MPLHEIDILHHNALLVMQHSQDFAYLTFFFAGNDPDFVVLLYGAPLG
jgi:hypothetical protein